MKQDTFPLPLACVFPFVKKQRLIWYLLMSMYSSQRPAFIRSSQIWISMLLKPFWKNTGVKFCVLILVCLVFLYSLENFSARLCLNGQWTERKPFLKDSVFNQLEGGWGWGGTSDIFTIIKHRWTFDAHKNETTLSQNFCASSNLLIFTKPVFVILCLWLCFGLGTE